MWSDALYSNLDVLVARVTPPGQAHVGTAASALLLSVHVDTQWNTEGATDNSVHVATLLELLDAVVAGCVAQSGKPRLRVALRRVLAGLGASRRSNA